jgi:hypothetical protein
MDPRVFSEYLLIAAPPPRCEAPYLARERADGREEDTALIRVQPHRHRDVADNIFVSRPIT